ncbi:MAG: NAD(P)/FAD-dependent oxidoreductase [Hyphomonadaceae bacterium]|nr:NAD(P)/FAD-dependent oxidoreductase [Hyphomonadaceae bacterium]
MSETFDVVIVGAGLSGVGAGVHLQKRCPGKSFVILENRDALGGTWDLFRYPGIRSDSDMFTLGYNFKPWRQRKAIADGASIRNYVNETAREHGLAPHIRLKHRVMKAEWSSAEARWTVTAEHEGVPKRFVCKFLIMATGYYNYQHGYQPEFKGAERFQGKIIHPQFWPEEYDYAGKRIAVIGSGATAMTLVPALAERAAHVTMVQRSPTWVVSLPAEDRLANWMGRHLPAGLAYDLTRFRKIMFQQFFFRMCRTQPEKVKQRLLGMIREQLGPDYDIAKDFTPRYRPWTQRLCLVPDNDLFIAIREGRASVETDTIETFTEKGLKLSSGKELEVDVIVTATGLSLQMMGGAEMFVDGAKVETGKSFAYKGVMINDVPNMVWVIFGYLNASWTLRADLISEYACRLINYLDEYGLDQATPRLKGAHDELPFSDFSSGYFQRAAEILPKQVGVAPWIQSQNYARDLRDLRHSPLEDGVLELKRRPQAPADRSSPKPAEAVG